MAFNPTRTQPPGGYFGRLARDVYANGFPCLPAHGKAIYMADWTTRELTTEIVDDWANRHANKNLGIRTGDGLIAIDIDTMDEDLAKAVEASAIQRFGDNFMVRVGQWPKRLMVGLCADLAFTKIKHTFLAPDGKRHGVEILAKGQQFIAYGIHPDTQQPYTWTTLDEPANTDRTTVGKPLDGDELREWFASIPSLFPADWKVETRTPSTGSGDFLEHMRTPLDIDRDAIVDALAELDPDMEHDAWVRVGMALHHQFNGSSEGLDLWEEWSARGAKFEDGVCRIRWDSFSKVKDGPVVTLRSVIKQATGAKTVRVIDEQVGEVETWRKRIEGAEDLRALELVAADLRSSGIDFEWVRFSVVCGAYRDRLKALTGTLVPMGAVREHLSIDKRERAMAIAEELGPQWMQGWYYLLDRDKFFHVGTKRVITRQGFDATFNREVIGDESPGFSAARMATDKWRVPIAASVRYLPTAGDVFQLNGETYVNSYRHDSPPPVPAFLSYEEEAAIAAVDQHFEMFFPDEDERGHILDWMAYNVQFPGKKIRWAPLIKGIEGDGKSVLMTILQAAMGAENVSPIAAHVIEKSEFTGWSVGQCVLVIEELKLQGHNRWDVANKLKPYLTNDMIPVNAKYLDPYMAPNTTNYLALTNYADALPITDTDRRYCVLFSPFTRRESLIEAVGGDAPAYFSRLHNAIHDHPGAIRHWLMSRDLRSFNPNGTAPETAAKDTLRALSKREDEELAREILETGAPGVTQHVFSSICLRKAIQAELEIGVHLETTRLNKLIANLGYQCFDRIKWRGEKHQVWVSTEMLRSLGGAKRGAELRAELLGAARDKVRAVLDTTPNDQGEADF